MRAITIVTATLLSLPLMGVAAPVAPPVAVAGVQLTANAQRTELVLPLSAAAEHSLFSLARPDRIVIDVEHATLTGTLPAGQGVVSGLRSGMHEDSLRIVLDLSTHATPRSFLRTDAGGPAIVVDLYPAGAPAAAGSVTPPVVVAPAAALASATSLTPPAPVHGRDIVVAVDAGHGGVDPGAHGPHGALEKNVTLAVARKLAAYINQQPGMKAVLTRESDVLVPLRERFQKARNASADMFVSIHCDASRDRSADGATVYVLSEHGASSEHAKALADRENYEELVGGVDLNGEPPQLRSVLVDMSQSAVMGMSFDAGTSVAKQLAAIGAMHRGSVQQAGFMVLKAPDVPSMLVETNYITNPQAAKLLMSSDYQQRLAQAIFDGVNGYFVHYPPPGTQLALLKDHQEGHAAVETAPGANGYAEVTAHRRQP